jgi:hypothetical protein
MLNSAVITLRSLSAQLHVTPLAAILQGMTAKFSMA